MTPTTVITAADLVTQVRALAAADPDAVTPTTLEHPHGNRYVVRGDDGRWQGSRLIGRALLALGADPDRLAEHDAHTTSAATTVMAFAHFGAWGQDLLWLNVVQRHEDKGQPWQRAVELADLRIPGTRGRA
ncbi:hypothetical protein [Nocardia transvalensis]|uniref:hypothetical protein n=1 Tax=Nocardia transvalensis TaxID=37333 RepID=UPI0018948839|nr:hypothetical protein [Nocardia transvalensis]MBF6333364.1 hypothetical protein [Nocardia transvalensis]